MKEAIVSAKAPAVIGPYSQAVKAAGFLFVSGQIPANAQGEIPQGIVAQTEQALNNVLGLLAGAFLGPQDVVKVTVYMTDLGQFSAMNEVYARFFKTPYPARATIGVAALPKGALIEIDAIAVSR